ncbi:MAG: aminotransferase class I/II-fold pyridoxal phosphate-dependent enzyme [Firmicutes bacterium]|nr:aminotransferase class I/II-fold pyridoxal phosphate-dependent enzyme [Bacillota bacterium]
MDIVNVHGGDIYSFEKFSEKHIIDFSVNINPLGVSKNIKKAIEKSIYDTERYPDMYCRELRGKIAEKENVGRDNVICSNGAAELIYGVVSAVRAKRVLIAVPSFSEYENAARAFGAEVIYYEMREEDGFEIRDDIIGWLDNEVDIAFLCSPNNPDGKMIKKELLEKIIEKCDERGIIAVIDESFIEFVCGGEKLSAAGYCKERSSLFVIRSFTKIYAIPYIRLGYGICGNVDIIKKIYKVLPPWNVSGIAQAVGVAAISEKEYVKKTREYVKSEREFIENEFKKMGIKYFKSEADFILFKWEKEKADKLIDMGILIRKCGNYRGLDEKFFRTAVRKHEDNVKLINCMKNIGV